MMEGDDPSLWLSFRPLLRYSFTLSGAALLSVAIQFPLGILIARQIGPRLLGIVGLIGLWQFYAALTKPGIYSAAQLELSALLAQGKTEEARTVQNLGITGEGLTVLIAAVGMAVAGLLTADPLLRAGLLVGAVVFVISQAGDFSTGIQQMHQRFGLVAKATAVSAVVSAGFVLLTLPWLTMYTPLLKIAVAACAAMAVYRYGAPPLGFRWRWDRQQMWRLFMVGIPLSMANIFYLIFRAIDQTAVAMSLPLTEVGYFTFAKQCVWGGVMLGASLPVVLQAKLWAGLGRAGDPQTLGPQIRQVTVWLFLLTCAMVTCAQASFGAMVHWFAPAYAPSVETFELLAFLMACGLVQSIPIYVLTSATVNRRRLPTVLWGAGVLLSLALTTAAVRAGWGLRGIALASVIAQTVISALFVFSMQRHVCAGWRDRLSLNGALLGLLAVTVGLYAAYHLAPLAYASPRPMAVTFSLRLAAACVVWAAVGGAVLLRGRSRSVVVADRELAGAELS